jgi:hypothetical protein
MKVKTQKNNRVDRMCQCVTIGALLIGAPLIITKLLRLKFSLVILLSAE